MNCRKPLRGPGTTLYVGSAGEAMLTVLIDDELL